MLGGRRPKFGFHKKPLTSPTGTFIIVGVDDSGQMIRYGTYDTLEKAKDRIAKIQDTGLTISVFTDANRTVYREER